ncbi:unnamed protein product [Acanthoscelides obtectus]|uniref:Uncharacterized protein n=1 Tax=Acanthoscelides obtectus TaxID=200917 RepID=A0A9P0KAN6_ACAOB|nr:unnamed protein product [Acanthoscelides obtectus]CAK1656035.1 hypothetical protein AOBTE_LOCUS19531 [Acanthoscelides obtectus]
MPSLKTTSNKGRSRYKLGLSQEEGVVGALQANISRRLHGGQVTDDITHKITKNEQWFNKQCCIALKEK